MKNSKANKCKCLTPELVTTSCSQSKTSSRSLVKFYSSIPDYEELHGLSETEFYLRLGTLRETYSRIKYGSDGTVSTDESSSTGCSIETVKESRVVKKSASLLGLNKSDKDNKKSRGSADSLAKNTERSQLVRSLSKASRRTKSASPLRRRTSLKGSDKMLGEAKHKNVSRFTSPSDEFVTKPRQKKKRAGQIPLTSRVPIYDQIVEDQKQRSQIRKLESAIELQSKIKPFHFSTRSRSRCSNASANSTFNLKKDKLEGNVAKPLNSNYFNSKKWEEDYFKRISRIIRAEELLKLSTPSPNGSKKDLLQSKSSGSCNYCCSRKRGRKKNASRQSKVKLKETNNNGNQKDKKSPENGSAENDDSELQSSILPVYPAARPNLAAKLRVEVAKKRVQGIPEVSVPKPTPHYNWGVRKTPAWKSLLYNETNDEDISFRLATRRAEQMLRQREHALSMELMRERVRAAPLLLEGTTYWSHRVGKASHTCSKENCNKYLADEMATEAAEKKRYIKSAGSSRHETKFVKKECSSANSMLAQRQNDSDDLESEDRAYL